MRIDDECAMNTGRLGSALVACLALLTVSCVPFAKALNRLPPQQTVHEGRPALRYDAEKGWFTIVDLVERDGEPMFRFRVAHHHGGAWGDATRRCRGFLLLSPTRIIFDPVLGPESADRFDVTRAQVRNTTSPYRHKFIETPGYYISLQLASKTFNFFPLYEMGREHEISFQAVRIVEFFSRAFEDFKGAEQEFRSLGVDEPSCSSTRHTAPSSRLRE
jgi:hypothetical protein